MKGLWLIIKILKSQNRLGNLIDFTVHIENIMGKAAYLPDLLNKDLGDTRVLINTYKIPMVVARSKQFKNTNAYVDFRHPDEFGSP